MKDEDMVDIGLSRLAHAPVPRELADIEQRVLHSIGAAGLEIPGSTIRGFRLAAAALALAMGIVAGASPSTEALASPASLSPLDGSSALAPSTLLLSGQ